MLSALLLAVAAPQQLIVQRDAYGVPIIQAATARRAFFEAGYAVAEDRLWQIELSRRLAQGRMAEVLGNNFAASDTEVLRTGYTDTELDEQFSQLSPESREAFESYASGINAYIAWAKANGRLPKGYSDNGFEPAPWTTTDSVAITIRLYRLFGRGGAGEIRNLALYKYLQSRPQSKGRELDVFADFVWFNEPKATPTVSKKDDLSVGRPTLQPPSRAESVAHLAMIPDVGLMELLPGVRLASNETSRSVAQANALPFKTGSYAIVVSKERSATGFPLLLNGPQMGFQNPAIIHEMAIACPSYTAAGMDIPGVPGIAIGHSRNLAWGLTSGVADTDDVFYARNEGTDIRFGENLTRVILTPRTLKIKGQPDKVVVRKSCFLGTAIIESKGTTFFLRSSYANRELQSYDAALGVAKAKSLTEAYVSMQRATMNFNTFIATKGGEIGYFYAGLVPIRAPGLDPRFPTPASPRFDWRGTIPASAMPHTLNPSAGLIANWNNKPADWWSNSDTPVWGRIFRNESILDSLPKGPLAVTDLEGAIYRIARLDPTARYFIPFIKKAMASASFTGPAATALSYLLSYDGRLVAGSQAATTYLAWFDALREELFTETTGNFISADNFRTAAQPSVMLKALEGQTVVPYLGKRTATEVVLSAFNKVVNRLTASMGPNPADWRYSPGGIRINDQTPIPYSDRGSYIQIVELGPTIRGRNVLPPGVAETGPHAQDQVPLSRAWTYKPMPIIDP